jgi:serine/threonine protein kinase
MANPENITMGKSGNDVKIYGEHISKVFVVDGDVYKAIKDNEWNLGVKSRMWNEFLISYYLSKDLKDTDIIVPNTKTFIVRAKDAGTYERFAKEHFPSILAEDSTDDAIRRINTISVKGGKRNIGNNDVEAFDVNSIIPSSRKGDGKLTYQQSVKQVILLVTLSPTMEGNGRNFIDKVAKGDENMISKFVIASCEKLSRLHTQGIIHQDFKLDNIVFKRRVDNLVVRFGEEDIEIKGFKYNVYLIDFEWSESFRDIKGYKNHTFEHWSKDEDDTNIRPYIPQMKRGYQDRTKLSNGFDVMDIDMKYDPNIRNYLNGVVPRVFGMDTYYILTDLIEIDPSNKIMRVLFRIFAMYRSLSIADSQMIHRGKVDYEDVEAEAFARMFISYFN